jgi:hypothetical protein
VSAFEVRLEGGEVIAAGDVSAAQAPAFCAALLAAARRGEGPARLALEALDLDDGVAVALAVDAVRALGRERGVVLVRAPQMLAHTLYKIGAVGSRIALEAPRYDEGTLSG